MTQNIPACPVCGMENTYSDGEQYICPDCTHEWPLTSDASADDDAPRVVKDANGQILQDGDTVTVIKDLKVKGSSTIIKVGTRAKGIRLLPDASDGHDIDCKLDGYGPMKLKSSVVKKA